jgi:hypothetical protein
LRPETFFQQKGVELGEQRFNNSGIGKIVTESPDGRTVGNLAGGMQTKKPRKRLAVENLVFQSLIGKIVQRLQNENLEHQNSVKADRNGIRLLRFLPGLFDGWSKDLPINLFVESYQWVASVVYSLKTDIEIEKSKLFHSSSGYAALTPVDFSTLYT